MTIDTTPQYLPGDAAVEPIQLVDEAGVLRDGARPGLGDDEVIEAYRWMLTARRFDEKCWSLQRQGKLSTFAPVVGQEGAVTGSAMALDPARDWIVPQYRELPAQLRHGVLPEAIILYRQGHPDGAAIPNGVNVLPYQVSLAAQIPHAVGIGWGMKLQDSDGVAVAYFGDGASSEGDFHESLNFAGALALPVIFFLQNNQWAISTPRSQQSAAHDLAARAPGYGMPGVSVDGNDLIAVHKVMAEAVARARAGQGPTLIEAQTFRLWAHTTADDPTRYVDEAVKERWQAGDPLLRIRRYLEHRGRLDEASAVTLDDEVTDYIEQAFARAAAHPTASPSAVYEHVFADPTPALERQRAFGLGEDD